jgi:hypothetical protein
MGYSFCTRYRYLHGRMQSFQMAGRAYPGSIAKRAHHRNNETDIYDLLLYRTVSWSLATSIRRGWDERALAVAPVFLRWRRVPRNKFIAQQNRSGWMPFICISRKRKKGHEGARIPSINSRVNVWKAMIWA